LWCITTFTVVQLIVGIGSEYWLRIRDPLYGDKAAKLTKHLRTRSDSSFVLMLGSSRTGLGFHALRCEQLLKSHSIDAVAFNFGIPAAGPVTQLLTLNRVLDRGIRPKVAVIEIMPSMLANDPQGPIERQWLYADRVTWSETKLLTRYGFDADRVIWRQWKSVILPAYTLRFQLMCRIIPSWLPWPVRFDWSRGADEGGWGTTASQQVADSQRVVGIARAEAEYAPTLHGLRPGGHAVQALQDLLRTCDAHNIQPLLILMPEGTPFHKWYGEDADNRLRACLNTLQSVTDCHVIDARGWLKDEDFYDAHHMLRSGAERFTDRLTKSHLVPLLQVHGVQP
jgi:hypothetical protein